MEQELTTARAGDHHTGATDVAVTAPRGPAKQQVIGELGAQAVLLPSLIGSALEANDRAKYFMALLQSARAQADSPSEHCSPLMQERLAAGVLDQRLDRVVGGARRVGDDVYAIPDAASIHAGLRTAMEEMQSALDAGDAGPGQRARLDALQQSAPDFTGDRVAGSAVDQITSGRRDAGDSVHVWVMDAHRALNQLQSRLVTTSVDGAAAYGIDDRDRRLISAFMRGVHATDRLKFDHPGLGTTATRVGARLLVQNDLGTTEAHVVVITVGGLTVDTTYTDVHRRRLEFFESLLDRFPVQWSDAQRRRGDPRLGEHHITTGRYEAADDDALVEFMEWLGSRLVFVLDWNRARKRLRTLVSNQDAIDLLRWAADHGHGHRAFLQLGAERLIYDAVELAANVPARYGESLIDVLGRDATLGLLRFALQTTAEGMLDGKTQFLIRGELRVEVRHHLQVAQRQLFDAACEHASLIVETAQALRGALVRLRSPDGHAYLRRAEQRAKRWEHQADEVLVGIRQRARHVDNGDAIAAITTAADDAIDALEEALFLLTLLAEEVADVVQPIVDAISTTAVLAAREHLKAVEIARAVVEGSGPENVEDFLIAVDNVVSLEHDADRADRQARKELVARAPDFRSLHVADALSRSIEEATDALLRSALGLRDQVLASIVPR